MCVDLRTYNRARIFDVQQLTTDTDIHLRYQHVPYCTSINKIVLMCTGTGICSLVEVFNSF
jgi:hypothetical protein